MFTRTVAAVAALSVAAAASASTVLFDNFSPGDGYESWGWLVGGDADWHLGPGFVVESSQSYTLDSISASIRHQTGPNTVTLSVYADDAGVPGALLEEITITDLPPHDGPAVAPTVFEFSGSTVLSGGSTYWVIASTDSAAGGSLAWSWNNIGDTGLHGQRQGANPWMSFPNFERCVIRVEGTPVVEPGNCPADLTGSDTVDVFDLLELLASWGPCGCPADLDGNGVVDVFDLLELLASWGPCPA